VFLENDKNQDCHSNYKNQLQKSISVSKNNLNFTRLYTKISIQKF